VQTNIDKSEFTFPLVTPVLVFLLDHLQASFTGSKLLAFTESDC